MNKKYLSLSILQVTDVRNSGLHFYTLAWPLSFKNLFCHFLLNTTQTYAWKKEGIINSGFIIFTGTTVSYIRTAGCYLKEGMWEKKACKRPKNRCPFPKDSLWLSVGCLASSRSYCETKTIFSKWKLKMAVLFLKGIVISCSWLDWLFRHLGRSRKSLSANYQGTILWRLVAVSIYL